MLTDREKNRIFDNHVKQAPNQPCIDTDQAGPVRLLFWTGNYRSSNCTVGPKGSSCFVVAKNLHHRTKDIPFSVTARKGFLKFSKASSDNPTMWKDTIYCRPWYKSRTRWPSVDGETTSASTLNEAPKKEEENLMCEFETLQARSTAQTVDLHIQVEVQ